VTSNRGKKYFPKTTNDKNSGINWEPVPKTKPEIIKKVIRIMANPKEA